MLLGIEGKTVCVQINNKAISLRTAVVKPFRKQKFDSDSYTENLLEDSDNNKDIPLLRTNLLYIVRSSNNDIKEQEPY